MSEGSDEIFGCEDRFACEEPENAWYVPSSGASTLERMLLGYGLCTLEETSDIWGRWTGATAA